MIGIDLQGQYNICTPMALTILNLQDMTSSISVKHLLGSSVLGLDVGFVTRGRFVGRDVGCVGLSRSLFTFFPEKYCVYKNVKIRTLSSYFL